MTVAPLAFYPDTNQWKPTTGASGAGFDSMAALVAFSFVSPPPDYVSVAMPDGRPQNFQRVASYPVAVIERLGNPSFTTNDFWGTLPAGASITGGNLVFTANANVTQTGLKLRPTAATYRITTVVSAYTSGTLTPTFLSTSAGTQLGTPIAAAGTNIQDMTTTTPWSSFRFTAGNTAVMTVASVSEKRVMSHACVVSADGLIWAPVGDINVLAYGVAADGVADDTAALLEAIGIAINLGRKALLPPARMRVTGPILDFLGTGIVQIEGDPARTTIVNEMMLPAPGAIFTVTGRGDAYNINTRYLTAPAARGARTLTVNDTSEFTVGQDILIKDWSQPVEYYDQEFAGDAARLSALSGEISRIATIDSPTQLGLGSQLEWPVSARTDLTGTVSTSGATVTGVGTAFNTELVPHEFITIAGIVSGSIATPLKIRSITSSTSMLLATNVATVSGAVATKLGGVVQRFLDRAELHVSGIKVVAGAVTVPNSNSVFNITALRRYTGRDLTFLAAGCAEFNINKCLRGRLINYHSEDAGTVGVDAYCIKVNNGVRGLLIENGYAMRPRHFLTTLGEETDIESAYIYHVNCHVDQPLSAAFDQHPAGCHYFYTGCGTVGADFDVFAGTGFSMRGRYITLTNCHASGVRYGLNVAFANHIYADNFLANGCDVSLHVTQSHHVDVDRLLSFNALTHDVEIDSNYLITPFAALPDIRIRGRGEGNPSSASVTAVQWGDDWRLDFRNPEAATKYNTTIPASHSHGIIAKTANFNVSPNLTCIYRTTGTVTATLPLLSSDTGEATYTFTEVSGTLTVDGNGAELIDGVASITPTGTVRVKKNGETGSWVSW